MQGFFSDGFYSRDHRKNHAPRAGLREAVESVHFKELFPFKSSLQNDLSPDSADSVHRVYFTRLFYSSV